MQKARQGQAAISGELLHGLLGLPDNIEVLDCIIQLRGPGLPEECIIPEGGQPTIVDLPQLKG